jgi:SAM-dependent methyltransferase
MSGPSKWDDRYGEAGFAYGTDPNDFLAASLHHLPPTGSILCLADGEGRNSVFLAEHGYRVTAVDSSPVGIEKGRVLAAERGVAITACVADLADYPLPDDTYDAIISIFCHLPPPLRRRLHGRIPFSLKSGGVFLLEGYTPRQLDLGTGGPPVKELLMELATIREELSPLRIIHGIELEREVREGRLHTGLGSVVQLIAVKEKQ